MSRANLDDIIYWREAQNRVKHKSLIRKYKDKAIGRIIQEIPKGKTFSEYWHELNSEIAAEDAEIKKKQLAEEQARFEAEINEEELDIERIIRRINLK